MGIAESKNIRIEFDGKKCIHAQRCVLGVPKVFNPGAKGQWMFPEQADVRGIAKLVESCPSGALKYQAKTVDVAESEPHVVTTAKLWENGPVEKLRGAPTCRKRPIYDPNNVGTVALGRSVLAFIDQLVDHRGVGQR